MSKADDVVNEIVGIVVAKIQPEIAHRAAIEVHTALAIKAVKTPQLSPNETRSNKIEQSPEKRSSKAERRLTPFGHIKV